MKRSILKTLVLSFFFSLILLQKADACHLASVSLVGTPTALGGGSYSITIRICTGSGASAMGLTCGTGAVGNTQNYTIVANGSTITSATTTSITSGFNGVVSTASVMSGSLTYSAPSTIYNIPATGDACGTYGAETQWCWNVTFVTSSLPTSIDVNGIEGVDAGQGAGSDPCNLNVIVPACTPPSSPTLTGGNRCGPGTVSLTASGCAGGTINWYANSTGSAGGASLGTGTTFTTPSISSTTTYYATCTVSGCTSPTSSAVATIKPIPTADAGTATPYCSGGSTTIGSSAVAGVTYSWAATTGLSSSTASNPTVSLTNATTAPVTTTYTVTATQSGCTATDVVSVTVNPVPTSAFTQTANACITGNSFTFTSNPSIPAGYTQTWTFGGGGASVTGGSATGNSVTVSYTSAGTYTITHVVTAAGGCTSTTTSTVTVFPLPVISVNSPSFCTGLSATLTASGANTYTWANATGLSSTSGTSVTANPASTTTYTVTGTSTNGCTATATSVVTVNPLPTVSATPITICNGSSGTLTASGANTYTWANSTGLSSTSGTSVTANPTATTTYTVTGTSAAGCVKTATVVVTVNPLPTVSATPIAICAGSSGTLTASGASTYTWANSTGLSGTSGTSVTANPASTTTYTVTGTAATTCVNTATVVVTVNPLPTVSATPITICNGSSGTLTASGAATYTWANSTGLSSTSGTSVTANPTTTTTYTVTGTSAATCVKTATVVVTVNPLPTVTATPISICNGSSGTLTASGASTYTWANSTGLSSTSGTSVTANPTSTTTYTVTGTAATTCVNTGTVVVTVNPLPTIVVNPITICSGSSGTLSASGASTYTWSPATGLSSTTGSSVTANPTSTTTYTVTGTAASTCVNTTTVVVTVTPLPVVSVNSPTICPTATATLTASGASTYTWTPGLSSTTGATVTGSPASTTSYTVTGTASGCSSTAVAVITIGGSLSVTVNSPTICNGQTATLNASGGTTYSWTAGLSSTSGASVTGSPTTTTSYTVTGNSGGCTGTAVATITVTPLPTISVSPIAICAGTPGTLTASGASTYTWANSTGLSATTGTSVTANPASTTTYTVTGTAASTCVNTTTVVVTVNPLPTVSATPISICTGSSGTLTASGAATYTWANAAGLSSTTGTSVTANPASTTTYTVTGTSAATCVNTASVIVTVNPLPTISVSPITICTGVAGTLTASGANTYTWSPATGLSSTTGSSVSANPASTTTYTVTGTSALTCVNTATVVVTVTPPATLSTTKVNVSCFGGTNGSITVNPVGGTTPYTYSWAPSGGTGATASGLAAGTYTVTVTTNNSCVSTTSATITQPAGMTLTMGSVNATCGTSNGQASVTVTGGVASYSYAWAPSGGTAATATGLAAGSYTVTVTDGNSCVSTNSVAVNNSLSPSASTTVISNVSCFGGSNGSASVSISGGTSPYTQVWSPSGGTGLTASSLTAGTYTVTVTDNVGCIVTANATITQPPVLTASTVKTDVGCFGGSTGTATVTAGGGTPGYTYSWTPSGGTGATASSLAANTYTVTVTDSKSCTVTATATITQPPVLTATTSSTPTSCFGGNNGTATVVAGSGTPGYSYSWAPSGGTGATASGLTSGTYTVTVTDLNGCTKTASTTVTQPTLLTVSATGVSSTCGAANGSATATPSGGTSTYNYSWAPSGGSSATASSLAAGTYTVTVTDSKGCTATASVTVNDLSGLTASITAQTNVSCFGGNNGSVTVTASGSTSPYSYSINGGTSYQASGTFGTLTAGSYTVIAKDANGCTLPVSVTITQPPALAGAITAQTNVLCFGATTGSVTVAGSAGTSPYTYAINGVTFGSSGTFSSLAAGSYTVTVKDANSCTVTVPVTITQPPALTGAISAQTNNICFGGNAGSVTITGSGGTSPYTFSSDGTTFVSSGIFSPLAAGSYTITVKDGNGCTTTVPVTITQPTQVTVSATKTDATCGTPNGTLTATGANGTSPYTYSINAVTYQSSGSFTGLAAATYTVTVKDANGCTNTTTTTIIDLSGLVASISAQTNVSCFGGNNGSVTITASGSTGPYTYSSDGTTFQASGTFGTLTAGSYNITAKDANGCTLVVPVTISQPTALSASISAQTNITCFGANNGSVTVTATGGTTAYQYSIDGGTYGSSATFSGLTAGNHTVNVKDANGCIFPVPVIITQPAVLTGAISSQINNLCFAGNSGSVTVAGSGGTTPYTYAIDGVTFGSSGTFSSLVAGSYTVTVKDGNGCTTTVPVTITQPTQVTVSATKTDATCGAPNGTLTATGANGTSPYTYSINAVTYQSSGSFTGLAAATYTVTVKDANGCTNTTTTTIIDLSGLVASISAQTNVSCFGGNNGSVTITASGSTGPYTYSSDGTTFQASGTFGTLTAGSYNITSKDANGCTTVTPVTITQPTVLTASISAQTNINCFGANNGSVTVTATGGTTTYSYSIDGGTYGSSATFSGLTPGSHTISVKDANGCTTPVPVTITEPAALTLATSSTNAICTAANGSATVNASGGTGLYTYLWSPGGQNTATANNITAGNYSVLVTDANGCSQTANISVGSSPGGTASISSSTNVTCTGANNGYATVTMSAGATPPYTYSWSPSSQTTVTAINLGPGTHNVTVIDGNGCIATTSVVITEPTVITNSFTNVNVTCFNGTNGSSTANPSGGTPPYTYLWSPGNQTTQTATGLSAGTYTVTITDGNSCTKTATTAITQPVAMGLTETHVDANCNQSNGSATVSVSGGVGPYTYSWSTAPVQQTTATATALAANTYVVTVTDANSCPQTLSVTINNLAGPVATVFSTTNVSCNGQSDGNATVTVNGGTAPYTFAWAPSGGNLPTATNLAAGTYILNATDVNGCATSTTATITEPAVLTTTYTATNPACYGSSTGSINSTTTGGTAPYSYLWSPGGATTSNITGLAAGAYTLQVTDAKGCVTTTTVNLYYPAQITATTSSTDVTCNGLCNGTATVNLNFATGPINYTWSSIPTQNTPTATALCSGTYTVTATDANSCSVTATATVGTPGPLSVNVISTTNVTCFGYNDGTASVAVVGGTAPFQYIWSPSLTAGPSVNNLTASSYTVTVSDANLCTATTSILITQPYQLLASIVHTDVSCYGVCDGSATALYTGGTGPYTFQWTPSFSTTPTIANVCGGVLDLTVTDSLGCQAFSEAVVVEPSPVSVTTTSTNSNCGVANGTACAFTTGGSPPFTYSWNDPAMQTSSCATALQANAYQISVTDSHGCSAVGVANVNDNNAPIVTIPTSSDVTCFGAANGDAQGSITGGIIPYTINWLPGSQTTTYINNLSGGIYSMVVTDSVGCTGSASVTIDEPAALVTGIIQSFNTSCNLSCDGSATVQAGGGTAPYTYLWNDVQIQSTATATALCAQNYSVTVTDAHGCSSVSVATINEPTPLVINVVSVTNVSCNGGNDGAITVFASGGTPGYTYAWSPSVGASSSVTNLVAGTYQLTVTDLNGCPKVISITITEPAPLVLTTTSNFSTCGNTNGSAGVSINGGTTPYSIVWSPGGSGNPIISPVAAGTYSVTVTDNLGCTASATATVADSAGPVINSITYAPPSCNGLSDGTAIVNASGGQPNYVYSWNTVPPQSSVMATALAAGTYAVTVTDQHSCSVTQSVTVTQPYPVTIITNPRDTICIGQLSQVYAAGSGGTPTYTYAWNPSTPPFNNTSGPFVVTPTSTTSYTVTAVDNHGCISPPAIATVFVNPRINVIATDTSVCDGSSVVISATAQGGTGGPYTYSWSNAVSGASQTVSPTGATSVNYIVTANDNCSIPVTDTSTVIVNPLPVLGFGSVDTAGCEPFTTSFTGFSDIGTSYTWNFGDGTGSIGPNSSTVIPHTYATWGTYNVSLTVMSALGCTSSVTYNNYIDVFPSPTAGFTFSPQPASTTNPVVTFTDQSVGANAWDWDFIYTNPQLGLYIDSVQNPVFSYPDSGVYVVQQIVYNSYGCSDVAYHNVEVEPEYVLYVPNAFTPFNHDGINDEFMPSGVGIDPEHFEMTIYDRWGNEIFKTTDVTKGWDGRANGGSKVAQIDVYVWKIKTKDFKGENHNYIGHVSLVK